MTTTGRRVTGDLLTADLEQRITAVAAGCKGPVRLLLPAPELERILLERTDVLLVDEFYGDDATLVAVTQNAPVPAELVELITAHTLAGGTSIVDTIAGDGIERRLRAVASEHLTLILQTRAACSVLTAADAVLGEATVSFPADALARGHADRLLAFTASAAAAGEFAITSPTSAVLTAVPSGDEIAALRRTIRVLESTNRRLAEGRLGVHDAAAGRAALASDELRAARERIHALEDQVEQAIFHAKQNDELFQGARLELFEASAHAARLESHVRSHQLNTKGWVRWQAVRVANKLRRR